MSYRARATFAKLFRSDRFGLAVQALDYLFLSGGCPVLYCPNTEGIVVICGRESGEDLLIGLLVQTIVRHDLPVLKLQRHSRETPNIRQIGTLLNGASP